MGDDSSLSSGLGGAAQGAAAGTAIAPGVGTVVGAGIGLLGGILGNDASSANAAAANATQEEEFYANLDFQKQLATSGVQMRVADMEKAGINPVLTATNGVGSANTGGAGVGVPTAQMPQYRNVGEAAANSAGALSAIDLQRANIDVAKTQAAVNTAQVGKIQADTANTIADNPRISNTAGYSGDMAKWDTMLRMNQAELAARQQSLTSAQQEESAARTLRLIPAEANSLNTASRLNTLRIPAAENEAAMQGTTWGKVLPYLHSFGGAANSAAAVAGALAK